MIFDLILSDVHLKPGANNKSLRREFEDFLSQLKDFTPRRIFCLGDIFDFWFEYKHVMFSDYFEILSAFYELHRKNVQLFFLGGNHDFWVGDTLQKIGFTILKNGEIVDFDGLPVMLIHGDGLNKSDIGYRIFKKIARNPVLIRLFRCIHPDWAMGIAQMLSRGSRTWQKNKKPHHKKEIESIKQWAIQQLQKETCYAIVAGHCHYPEMSSIVVNNVERWYVNLGAWFEHKTFAIWADHQFHLCSGDIKKVMKDLKLID